MSARPFNPSSGAGAARRLALLLSLALTACRERPPPPGASGSATPPPSAPPVASAPRPLSQEDEGDVRSGAPVELLARGVFASSIRIDGGALFWVTREGIARTKGAGDPPALLVTEAEIAHLAVDGTHLYWLRSKGGGRDGFEVRRAPRGGGAPELLARGVCAPRALSLDAAHVYFVGECDSGISRVAKRGGPVEKAAPVCAGGGVKALVVDGATARLTWLESEAACSAPAGGPSERLASGPWPAALALQGDVLYGSDGSCGGDCLPHQARVWRRPRSGGPLEVLAERQAYVPFVAASAAHVVWVTELGALRRARAGGGPITTLWRGRRPVSLALGEGTIAWATDDGDVLRLAESWGE